MKQRNHRLRGQDEPQTITRAVTHIRLGEANSGKLAALDELAQVYLTLCQQYINLFCTDESPDKFHLTCFATPLSQRWHRVTIQQAAGIARAFRTNREQAYQDYVDDLLDYHEQQAEGILDAKVKEPVWREWNIPVKLADYHRKALSGKTINSSVTLNKREDGWWLTLSYDEVIPVQTDPSAPVVGIDVGIANFLTTSTGKHYGTFHGKLRERQKRDREKRRRKAKLRKCLEKKGARKLPSTSSKSGQRLSRHVRQEINRAVNLCLDEHPQAQIAYEQLSVASMKYKARAMNAYLYASNLAHLPSQIAWNATKRGVQATRVKSAYSSQERNVCHYVDRKNRPDQQTFCCQVCHQTVHADLNAARNIAQRLGDAELHACTDRKAVKALLMRRHAAWCQQQGCP
ncbi:MAG TPA: transposase [Ktedonobacteraceae bacterium]